MLPIKTCLKGTAALLAAALWTLSAPAVAVVPDFGRLNPNEVALFVQDLHTGQIVAEHRADAAMNPASNMKLVTTFAALIGLGGDFRWRTEWYRDGAIVNGHLQGNLYWKGSGDPSFDQKDLLDMLEQLRTKGINVIDGDLVLDRSVWSDSGTADDFAEDVGQVFATPPDPHMLAYKVVWLTAASDMAGQSVIETNPPLPPHLVESSVTFGPEPYCRDLKTHVRAAWRLGRLTMSGHVPQGCAGKTMFVNAMRAPEFAAVSFNGHWTALGGVGPVQVREGKTPAAAERVAVHDSKPLADVVRDMNKNSNNIIARSIFLTLGAQGLRVSGKKGVSTTAAAQEFERIQLRLNDIDTRSFVVENGSGYSRRDRVSARMLGQILAWVWKHENFRHDFINSLPVGGQDGTLKTRFRQSAGQLHMKTGTLKNVRSLSGYWLPETPGAHPLAVVVIVNSPTALQKLNDLDNLVRSLVATPVPTLESDNSSLIFVQSLFANFFGVS